MHMQMRTQNACIECMHGMHVHKRTHKRTHMVHVPMHTLNACTRTHAQMPVHNACAACMHACMHLPSMHLCNFPNCTRAFPSALCGNARVDAHVDACANAHAHSCTSLRLLYVAVRWGCHAVTIHSRPAGQHTAHGGHSIARRRVRGQAPACISTLCLPPLLSITR